MDISDTNSADATFDVDETLEAAQETNDILGRGMLYALQVDCEVLWVVAAGNENRDAKFQSPASLSQRFPLNVITVASIDENGERSAFSNFGSLVSVAAPGGRNLTTPKRTVGRVGFCGSARHVPASTATTLAEQQARHRT